MYVYILIGLRRNDFKIYRVNSSGVHNLFGYVLYWDRKHDFRDNEMTRSGRFHNNEISSFF